MDKAKQWVALAIAAALVLLAGGWFLLVAPQRSEAAQLEEQSLAQDASNDQLRTQLEVLRAKAVGLPAQRAALAEVTAKIPETPELPSMLRALTAAGRAAGVQLAAVTPGASVAVSSTGQAPATEADATAGGLSAIPLTMRVTGDYYSLEQFVAGLEDLPRALRVTGLALEDGSDPAAGSGSGRELTATVSASVFVRSPAAPPAAAPAAAVPAAAAPAAGAPAATPDAPGATPEVPAAAPAVADAGVPVS